MLVRQSLNMFKQKQQNPNNSCCHHQRRNQQRSHNNSSHESRRASSRGLIPKAKVKTVKMTFVIIFVFILCWSPYIVFDLLQVNNKLYSLLHIS